MKILHVVTSTGIGGAQTMLLRYLQSLGEHRADHGVVSLLPDGPVGPLIRDLGVPVIDLSVRNANGLAQAVLALRRELARQRPMVVHAWMYHACLASWAARALLPGSGMQLIWAIHHSLQDIANEKPRSRAIIRAMAALSRRTDVITYCSEVSRGQHEAIGFARERGTFIPNATDVERFRADPEAGQRLAAMCAIPGSRIILGNAARAHPMKDHATLVRATAILLEQGHDVQAVIVGEGHLGSRAQQLAAELGIADRVTFLPATDAVEAIVAGFDIFVLSSAWGEAFSIALTEAMSAEVPAVVTDVGDSARIVDGCGISVPPGRPDELARGIAELIDAGEARRHELGRAGRRRVLEKYTMADYVRRHMAIYRVPA
jgi:glycosyltransferase involved in cell wall biosynthesis